MIGTGGTWAAVVSTVGTLIDIDTNVVCIEFVTKLAKTLPGTWKIVAITIFIGTVVSTSVTLINVDTWASNQTGVSIGSPSGITGTSEASDSVGTRGITVTWVGLTLVVIITGMSVSVESVANITRTLVFSWSGR